MADNIDLILKDPVELTDLQLFELLQDRYGATEIPCCRICGGQLEVASIGGSQDTKYACRDWQKPVDQLTTYDHYARSAWYDHKNGGDRVVLELIDRFKQLTEFM